MILSKGAILSINASNQYLNRFITDNLSKRLIAVSEKLISNCFQSNKLVAATEVVYNAFDLANVALERQGMTETEIKDLYNCKESMELAEQAIRSVGQNPQDVGQELLAYSLFLIEERTKYQNTVAESEINVPTIGEA